MYSFKLRYMYVCKYENHNEEKQFPNNNTNTINMLEISVAVIPGKLQYEYTSRSINVYVLLTCLQPQLLTYLFIKVLVFSNFIPSPANTLNLALGRENIIIQVYSNGVEVQ